MLDQDGNPLNEQASGVAEITGLSTRTGWPDEQRLIARRVRLGRSKDLVAMPGVRPS
jgi:hypothetical protein